MQRGQLAYLSSKVTPRPHQWIMLVVHVFFVSIREGGNAMPVFIQVDLTAVCSHAG